MWRNERVSPSPHTHPPKPRSDSWAAVLLVRDRRDVRAGLSCLEKKRDTMLACVLFTYDDTHSLSHSSGDHTRARSLSAYTARPVPPPPPPPLPPTHPPREQQTMFERYPPLFDSLPPPHNDSLARTVRHDAPPFFPIRAWCRTLCRTRDASFHFAVVFSCDGPTLPSLAPLPPPHVFFPSPLWGTSARSGPSP